jgi:hypothetical protein
MNWYDIVGPGLATFISLPFHLPSRPTWVSGVEDHASVHTTALLSSTADNTWLYHCIYCTSYNTACTAWYAASEHAWSQEDDAGNSTKLRKSSQIINIHMYKLTTNLVLPHTALMIDLWSSFSIKSTYFTAKTTFSEIRLPCWLPQDYVIVRIWKRGWDSPRCRPPCSHVLANFLQIYHQISANADVEILYERCT